MIRSEPPLWWFLFAWACSTLLRWDWNDKNSFMEVPVWQASILEIHFFLLLSLSSSLRMWMGFSFFLPERLYASKNLSFLGFFNFKKKKKKLRLPRVRRQPITDLQSFCFCINGGRHCRAGPGLSHLSSPWLITMSFVQELAGVCAERHACGRACANTQQTLSKTMSSWNDPSNHVGVTGCCR